ncbi:E3 ubiquitin-protein ligase MARCHF1-like isoform X2 [Achroia grisella]|uniref:E3 ubiquitin-protein ligase MARCHF1-like isoform X2 n=1 Tax=Achroia grisella TaxID=688607 RepID=UPI0027D2AEFE|nr:E3 ubiquitin-protein ligase MARCHF1-like isoform X2 [Achroia grisella]
MDNKAKDETDEESTSIEDNLIKSENNKEHSVQLGDDAGPSGSTSLPGAVPDILRPAFQAKPGLSKSEHSLRKIITNKDVADALKSLNFGTPSDIKKGINVKELEISILDKKQNTNKDDTTSFIDLKKFMASCFKMNKDGPNTVMIGEIPVSHNLQSIPTINNEVVQQVPNTSCNDVQTQNFSVTNIPNEVIVTNTGPVELKQSKVGSDKKKTSGSLSERSDFCLAQRDSLSSIGSNVCRICMTRGRERLISPCNCKGSLANVHLSCLERWLNQVGRNHCELCGFSYPAIRTPRYTVLQALRLWFGNPRNRSHLQSDCLIFWLLSTVTAGLLAVCIVGTQYFVIEGNKFGISHRITETAMDFFMAIVLCGYSVTVYLLWKDHYVMWNRWRRANVNVRLLLSPDANPVPFVPRPRYNIV